MRPPLYRLSYSAVGGGCPSWARIKASELKPGAYQLREGGTHLVPRAGFEPTPSDLKDRCPWPLDERGDVGAGSEDRTRIFCLEGSGSDLELSPLGGWRILHHPIGRRLLTSLERKILSATSALCRLRALVAALPDG